MYIDTPSALPTILHALVEIAKILAIPLIGVVGPTVGYLIGRRKQTVDIAAQQASTHKTEAETRQIDSELAFRAWERIEELNGVIDRLREARREYHEKIEVWERRCNLMEIQLRKALQTLTDNKITFDEKAALYFGEHEGQPLRTRSISPESQSDGRQT